LKTHVDQIIEELKKVNASAPISSKQLKEIFTTTGIELTEREWEYVISKTSIEGLDELSCELIEELLQLNKSPRESYQITDKKEEYNEDFESLNESNAKPQPKEDSIDNAIQTEAIKAKSERELSQEEAKQLGTNSVSDSNEINIDEEKMIEETQIALGLIAEQMIQQRLTIYGLFGNTLQKEVVNEEEIKIVSTEDFVKVISSLDIPVLEQLHYLCLIKVLAANEDQSFIKFDDLVQVLKNFNVPEKENRGKSLSSQELDSISKIIMLALAEYLPRAEISISELFANVTYQQLVKTKGKEKKVELINSADFFSLLCKIGINLEDTEHENLKDFLCLDKKHRDKLYLKKLKRTVNEFMTNDELRKEAKDYYNQLLNNQER